MTGFLQNFHPYDTHMVGITNSVYSNISITKFIALYADYNDDEIEQMARRTNWADYCRRTANEMELKMELAHREM